MSRRGNRTINLPAPYLKRVWLEPSRIGDRDAYPFCLPIFADEFELSFDKSITIIVGENGTGKSTILEGIAALAGYDDAGGGKGYMPVDHSQATEKMGGVLSKALRRAGCPRLRTAGSFAPRAFSPWRDISIKLHAMSESSGLTFFRIRTVKVFCASSRSVVSDRAFSSSTSRSRRCRHRASSNF